MLKRYQRKHTIRIGGLRASLGLAGCLLAINFYMPRVRAATVLSSNEVRQLVRDAQNYHTAGSFEQAKVNLETAVEQFADREEWQPLAATLTNLGRVQYATGQLNHALQTWERAATVYQEHLDDGGAIINLKVLQAEALKELGLYPRACRVLTQALSMDSAYCTTQAIDKDALATMPSSPSGTQSMEVVGWRNLGTLLRAMGRLEESQAVLEAQVAQLPTSPAREASVVRLGLTLQKLADRERDRRASVQFDYLPWRCEVQSVPVSVRDAYERAEAQLTAAVDSSDPLVRTQAHLNLLALVANRGTQDGVTAALATQIDLETIALGHPRIYARLQAAKSHACLQQLGQQAITWDALTRELKSAIQDARQIGDRRAESAAWGHLGELYELRASLDRNPDPWHQRGQAAIEQALMLSQSVDATDLSYQWEWQLGRLLRARGQEREAIVAYKAATESLESTRRDLLAVDADVQFSFRDNVEPLYRELVDLLIPTEAEVASLPQEELQQALASSLYYVESLQLAELENFLQCNLLGNARQTASSRVRTSDLRDRVDRIFSTDPSATLIYPVLLKDRIAMIVRTPDGQFQARSTSAAFTDVSRTIELLQRELQRSFNKSERVRANLQKRSTQLYEWLIAPIEDELAAGESFEDSKLKTLVFVLDGPLRNIPMAALYDRSRQRYLLERYAIAQTSGMQLLETGQRRRSSALVAGLSEAREFEGTSFVGLPSVSEEVETISRTLSGDTLQDKEFIRQNLEKQISGNSYSIVHIATHGKFSSDPDKTFLLLSDGLLKAREFDRLLQTDPDDVIELLVLSACETAQGDRRAALGLAGIALRAGTLSTLATLWQVDDESTAELMARFYQTLTESPSLSKAEALRHAQLQLWENDDSDWKAPFYWAPYTLLGSWL